MYLLEKLEIITLVCGLLAGTGAVVALIKFNLHMFQLNGYKNGEHLHWIKKNARQFRILTLDGVLALAAVLLVPPLEPLFQVAELSAGLVAAIVGLAFGSMVVIQILKAIRSMGKK